MKRRFIVWLSIFLSIAWLTVPGHSESVNPTEAPKVRLITDGELQLANALSSTETYIVTAKAEHEKQEAIKIWNAAVAEQERLRQERLEAARAARKAVTHRGGSPQQNRALGQQLAAQRGWTGQQWTCLDTLWGNKESGWDQYADNPNSSAYGIPQALPGSKMASHGDDWRTNPATQIRWGLDYIAGRYKTPCGALAYSNRKGWY